MGNSEYIATQVVMTFFQAIMMKTQAMPEYRM